MARLVVLRSAGGADEAVVVRRVRWRERLMARVRSSGLDSQLAAGVPPAISAPLSLRAQTLGQSHSRTLLAEQILHVLGEAQGAHRTPRAQVPRRRSAILAAGPELEELAVRLLAGGPVAAHGLAQVRLLLTDGSSPLYFGGASEGLRAATARAFDALHPTFGW
jgi:hypothetical protein